MHRRRPDREEDLPGPGGPDAADRLSTYSANHWQVVSTHKQWVEEIVYKDCVKTCAQSSKMAGVKGPTAVQPDKAQQAIPQVCTHCLFWVLLMAASVYAHQRGDAGLAA